MILTSILITQKFFNDKFYGNLFIAKIGGVSTSELNVLEQEFLEIIDFDINFTMEEYLQYDQGLKKFFENELNPETARMVQNVLSQFYFLNSLETSYDLMKCVLPSQKLQSYYEIHMVHQLQLNHIISQPEINLLQLSKVSKSQVMIML